MSTTHEPLSPLDARYVNEYIEAFEAFQRTAAAPIAEEITYEFHDLRPPYLFPTLIAHQGVEDPIESISITADGSGPGRALNVQFGQASGNYLLASRSAAAAKTGGSFLLQQAYAIDRRETFIDTIDAKAVGRFLLGLTLSHESRQLLALDECSEKVADAYIDPQSTAFFEPIMLGLDQAATNATATRRYGFTRAQKSGIQTIDIETIQYSNGHNEYELAVKQLAADAVSQWTLDMRLSIAHTYSSSNTAVEAAIIGRSNVANNLEITPLAVEVESWAAYGLSTLKSVIQPAELTIESLRKFCL